MLTFIKKEDVLPVCPHCRKEIETVWFKEIKEDLGKRCLYFCPECKMIISISHRKGLTMGF